MNDSRPRDLTPEELALIQLLAPSRKETAPLRIPPGTEVAIEVLNPVANTTGPTSSVAADQNEAADAGSGGTPKMPPPT